MAPDNSFLVTGAAGFVGSCLTRRLIEEGKRVYAFVKPGSDNWRLKDIQNRLDILVGDLTDQVFVFNTVKKISPTVIYHLATHGAYASQDEPQKIFNTNILGTWNLLNALNGIKYKVFINTGSSSEYGFKKVPMKEIDFLEPNSYYAVAKAAQTLLCQHFARAQKKPICTFRLFSVYGFYEEPTRLVPTLIRSCIKGEDLNMVQPNTARDFVFVGDVVDAYLKIDRLSQLSGEIINIGSGIQTGLKDVVKVILELTKAKVKVHWGKMPARSWDTNIWQGDVSKAKKILGWKARTSLREGLRKTIQWFRK